MTPVAALPLPIRDPNDEMVRAAALGGGADLLVTGDNDLLSVANDPRLAPLRIVPAAGFAASLML